LITRRARGDEVMGMIKQRRKNKPWRCKMRKETEGEVELKLSFSLQLLIYQCSWTNSFFADGEIATNKNNLGQLFKTFFN